MWKNVEEKKYTYLYDCVLFKIVHRIIMKFTIMHTIDIIIDIFDKSQSLHIFLNQLKGIVFWSGLQQFFILIFGNVACKSAVLQIPILAIEK